MLTLHGEGEHLGNRLAAERIELHWCGGDNPAGF